jgi:pyridoxine 4-dehydrogenase
MRLPRAIQLTETRRRQQYRPATNLFSTGCTTLRDQSQLIRRGFAVNQSLRENARMFASSDRPVLAGGTFTLAPDSSDPLTVRRMGFGAMRITGKGIWGEPDDRDEAIRVLRRAVDLGVDLIDTADSYGPHVSETLIRQALFPYDGMVIATKGGLTRQGPDQWEAVGRAPYLRQCVHMSLRRLGVDRIDLWQLHRIDPRTPREEQFSEIAQLQSEGLIRHVGLSEVAVEDVREAQQYFEVVSVQNLYNVGDRSAEQLLDFAAGAGIGFIPWFPLGGRTLVAADSRVAHIAARVGGTPSQVALAWLLQRSPNMLPIPGTGSVDHLEENCSATEIALDAAAIEELDSLASA